MGSSQLMGLNPFHLKGIHACSVQVQKQWMNYIPTKPFFVFLVGSLFFNTIEKVVATSSPPPATTQTSPSQGSNNGNSPPLTENSSVTSALQFVVPVRLLQDQERYIIEIDWPSHTSATMWAHNGKLYCTFDQASHFSFPQITIAHEQWIPGGFETFGSNGFVLPLAKNVHGKVTKNNKNWQIELYKGASEELETLSLQPTVRKSDQNRRVLVVPLKDTNVPVCISHQGQRLWLVATSKTQAFKKDFEGIDFSILPAFNGMVISTHLEDLTVSATSEGIIIDSPQGLALSDPADLTLKRIPQFNPLYDFMKWQHSPKIPWEIIERQLEAYITQSYHQSQWAALYDMVKFYLATGYAYEALGILRAIEGRQPEAINQFDHNALKGAGQFLIGRHHQAIDTFSQPLFTYEDEARLWKAVSVAGSGSFGTSLTVLQEDVSTINNYPRNIRHKFAMLGLEGACILKQDGDVFLKLIEPQFLSSSDLSLWNYYKGCLALKKNDLTEVLKTWDLASSSEGKGKQLAQTNLTKLKLTGNTITKAAAIKNLESIRYSWRGDRSEFELLQLLGNLYIESKEWRSAFRTLEYATKAFNFPETNLIKIQLKDLFLKLYTDPMKFSSVEALAFYQEFKEWGPSGPQKNYILQKLADEMVKLNLLDEAIALLSDQLKAATLDALTYAKIINRIGFAHLLNNNPKACLDVLNRSEIEDEKLRAQRNELKIYALTKLGKLKELKALLGDDYSQQADIWRSVCLWGLGDWEETAKALERLSTVHIQNKTDKKVDPVVILDWAIALFMLQDEEGLAQLYKTYNQAIQASKEHSTFELITHPTLTRSEEVTPLVEQLTKIHKEDNLLKFYHQKIQTSGISVVN